MTAHFVGALLILSLSASQQVQLGTVRSAEIASNANGTVIFRVTGDNPCGAVHFIYGDGAAVTHPIVDLPTTITYTYTRSGDYQVVVQGRGNCQGEVTTRVRAVVPDETSRPASARGGQAQGRNRGRGSGRGEANAGMRFAVMDRNSDGVITRDEWEGSLASFRVHDWNADGVLSGAEVEPRTARQAPVATEPDRRWRSVPDWSSRTFVQLDRDNDGRVTAFEWAYDAEIFRRVDRDGNRAITAEEFSAGDADDDRDDRFEDLDINRDGYLSGTEWHGSTATFEWLDQDGDRRLSRLEVVGEEIWVPASPSGGQADAPRTVRLRILADQAWQDTGIIVRAGDEIVVRARGEIQWAGRVMDRATAAGSTSGDFTGGAPLPDVYAGALIARVDQSRPFRAIVPDERIRMPQFGRLFLGINDDNVADNLGFFDVTVQFVR